MSIPVGDRPRRFLDIETTGLDREIHEILEIAIIDERGRTLLHTKVKPERIEMAHPQALEINNYSAAAWADAPRWIEIAADVVDHLRGAVIFGHYVRFDYGFVRYHLKKVEVGTDKLGHHTVDTATLAWEHLVPIGLPWLTLNAICTMLGISNKDAHTALADAQRCRRVYNKLLRAGWLRKLWWGLAWIAWRKRRARKKK